MHTETLLETDDQLLAGISDEQLAREHRPFDDKEVDAVLEDVPQAMLEGLIDSVRGFKAYYHEDPGVVDLFGEIAHKSNKGRLSGKGRLMENLAWAFNLYEEPPIVNFEWVCREKESDPEHVRAMLSRAFAAEIRDFALAVYRRYPGVGRRIQTRMRGYVDIELPFLH